MDVSVRALPEDERERFAELAVFGLYRGAGGGGGDAVGTHGGAESGACPRSADESPAAIADRFRSKYAADGIARSAA